MSYYFLRAQGSFTMQSNAAVQFNKKITTFDRLPMTFFGKDEGSPFAGLSGNQRAMLGKIYTLNSIFGESAEITYDDFCAAFHMSRSTVCKNLKTLIEKGLIKKAGRSRYIIVPSIDEHDYLVIKHFLYTETWNINGKMKRLPRQSVFMCALVERDQNNPKTKDKPFVCSKQRFATALDIPLSTAFYGIKAALRSGAMHRNVADDDGNVKEGKGVNNHALSAFSVDRNIRNIHCRKVPQASEPKQTEPSPLDQIARDMIAERKAKEVDARLQLYATYCDIKEQLKQCKRDLIAAMRIHNAPLEEELSRHRESLLKQFRRYLKNRDVSEELTEAIIKMYSL